MMVTIVVKRRPEAGQRFPFIPLGRALERARELYKVANGHDIPFTTAATAWSYAEKSSGAAQTAAALKAFGLLEDVAGGDIRKIKLTEAALRIIRDPREISPDRDTLIREAALKPLLHREIIDKYKGMPPSDEALKAYLMMDRGMKDEAVPGFIREFATTMSFAKIAESGAIQDMEPEVPEPIPETAKEVPTVKPAGASVAHYSKPLPQFPAGAEMNPAAGDQYNVATYSSPEGSRIRVTADLDIVAAKKLVKILENRIRMIEEEEGL